ARQSGRGPQRRCGPRRGGFCGREARRPGLGAAWVRGSSDWGRLGLRPGVLSRLCAGVATEGDAVGDGVAAEAVAAMDAAGAFAACVEAGDGLSARIEGLR